MQLWSASTAVLFVLHSSNSAGCVRRPVPYICVIASAEQRLRFRLLLECRNGSCGWKQLTLLVGPLLVGAESEVCVRRVGSVLGWRAVFVQYGGERRVLHNIMRTITQDVSCV